MIRISMFLCAANTLLFSQALPIPEPLAPLSYPGLHVLGDAQVLSDRLRLTPAERQTVGAAWFAEKQHISDGFDAVFRFQISETGGLGRGADGLAFVIQNQGVTAIAGRGAAGGWALEHGYYVNGRLGIPHCIAVFFDTYQNGDARDPSDNYIAVATNAGIAKMRWPPNRLGIGTRLKVRLKDGKVHTAHIRFTPPLLSVSLDNGEPDVRIPIDMRSVLDNSGSAYVGFTASTGNGYENHDILGIEFHPAEKTDSNFAVVQSEITFQNECLEGRNLCTPPKSTVEENGPGRYHVVLPAHLLWGASIPNLENRAILIENAKGAICFDAGPTEVCGGAEGVENADRKTLIEPSRNAGALLYKTESGRTLFSVNGPKGRSFSKNQGLFEFDVILR